jgi:hypothetical protein
MTTKGKQPKCLCGRFASWSAKLEEWCCDYCAIYGLRRADEPFGAGPPKEDK